MLKRYLKALVVIVVIAISGLKLDSRAEDIALRGGGATFPYPLYKQWIELYRQSTGRLVMYQSIGSSAGIEGLRSRQFDFGATDAFLPDDSSGSADQIVHVPTCLGAVAVTCNLSGVKTLYFSPDTLALIFLGRISSWKQLQSGVNQNVDLPDLPITVIHRSDGSGTTAIFTGYLSKVNAEWKQKIGSGKLVEWPVGVGVDGNQGVLQIVSKVPGAVCYIEWAYVASSDLTIASIRNRNGSFIQPSVKSITAAAGVKLPNNLKVVLTNTEAPDGYPIAGFTYLIAYREQNYQGRTIDQAKALQDWLWWTIHAGQATTEKLFYAPLPDAVVQRASEVIQSMQFGGALLSSQAH
jgi:phosphate transport system substrate-binding protein